MDNKTKIIFLLRIILLVFLIYFLFIFNTSIKTDCEACSFNIKGKEYSALEFYNIYYDKCLVKTKLNDLNLDNILP